jgi:hypothetical protein
VGSDPFLVGITNGRDSFRALVGSATYVYDALNRVQSAATTGTDCTMVNGFTKNWGESYTIDPWGNLTDITPNKCSAENLHVGPAPNNQLSGYCYDAAGNLTGVPPCPASQYVYDAESRIKSAMGVSYTYDGDGKRVKKDSGKLYWSGTGSDPLTETDLSGNPTADYIFFNGNRIARGSGPDRR